MKAEVIVTDNRGKVYRGVVDLSATERHRVSKSTSSKSAGKVTNRRIRTVPEALALLHQQGFFQTRRRRAEVSKKLESMRFNFTGNTLSMALAAAPFLSRFGKLGDYSFAQKYPPEK
jgi:hypothetical protein